MSRPHAPALERIRQLQARHTATPQAPDTLRRIVIVGGGSAGWMAAAALSNVLGPACSITLVESEQLGTVGVGEATIPTIRLLNQTMGVNEPAFMRDAQATFKLGIEFVNWGREGNRYFHPFGFIGRPFDAYPVYQHWIKNRHLPGVGTLDDYSVAWQAGRLGRFKLPTHEPQQLSSSYNYAFHFDANLYAQHLRGLSVARGVQAMEGLITHVHRDRDNGFVSAVQLQDGRLVEGDFFIDCSGFRSVLLGETLGVALESWAHWLPCDRAVAVPCASGASPAPYTRATALEAGWQWTIPLQHRVGNGHVFSSAFIDEARAVDTLLSRLPAPALGEPRLLKFTPGRRRKAWEGNVVALGLASGFLEPLESTSLHLVHSGIISLLSLFPDRHCHTVLREEYNRRFANEMERIRDFIILHYALNTHKSEDMWRHCSHMPLPDSLQERMALFKHGGYVQIDHFDLFGVDSWQALHSGQLNFPRHLPTLLDMRGVDGREGLQQLRQAVLATAERMPDHKAFLNQYLAKPH